MLIQRRSCAGAFLGCTDEPQLAAIAEHLERVMDGVGGVMIIEGQAGFGKTSLVHAAASHPRARGFRTGIATADAGRSSIQMAVLLEAVLGGADPLVDQSQLGPEVRSAEASFWLLQRSSPTWRRLHYSGRY